MLVESLGGSVAIDLTEPFCGGIPAFGIEPAEARLFEIALNCRGEQG
jgi:hypothetical protein